MTLATEATTRLANDLLLQLTNQGDKKQTTINTTVLAAASDDAEARFGTLVGVAFDDSVASHVAAGVQGVLYYLRSYIGRNEKALENARMAFENQCNDLARTIGSKKSALPQTSSVLTPSSEVSGQRPDGDRTRWRGVMVNLPPGSTTQERR